ncbi:UNVERIFIED_ORG: hypothetical protein CLV66_10791 [Actinomadura viridilutea]
MGISTSGGSDGSGPRQDPGNSAARVSRFQLWPGRRGGTSARRRSTAPRSRMENSSDGASGMCSRKMSASSFPYDLRQLNPAAPSARAARRRRRRQSRSGRGEPRPARLGAVDGAGPGDRRGRLHAVRPDPEHREAAAEVDAFVEPVGAQQRVGVALAAQVAAVAEGPVAGEEDRVGEGRLGRLVRPGRRRGAAVGGDPFGGAPAVRRHRHGLGDRPAGGGEQRRVDAVSGTAHGDGEVGTHARHPTTARRTARELRGAGRGRPAPPRPRWPDAVRGRASRR